MPFTFLEDEIRQAAVLLLRMWASTGGEAVDEAAGDFQGGMWGAEATDDPAVWARWNTILAETLGLTLVESNPANQLRVFRDAEGRESTWSVRNGYNSVLLEGIDPSETRRPGRFTEVIGINVVRELLDEAMDRRPVVTVSEIVHDLRADPAIQTDWAASIARVLG